MKTNKQTTNTDLDVGAMLTTFFTKHRLSKSALARHIGVTPSQVFSFLNGKSIKTSALLAISHAFQHNFFADIAATLPAHYVVEHPETALQDRIKALETQLNIVTAERDVLKEVLRNN